MSEALTTISGSHQQLTKSSIGCNLRKSRAWATVKFNLPSLKALRAVETVGRHGSITSAATEMNVTPGAISRHITLLEGYFDCKLFVRHTTGLALTEVGRQYVDQLTEAFNLIDQASTQILRSGDRTTLVIRSLGAFGTDWLLPRIAQFENEHPAVEVSVRATLRGVDFDTDDADVGIIGSQHEPRGVDSIKLYTPYLTPIVSADLLKGKPAILSVSDLQQFKLLHAMNLRPSWQQWASKVEPDHSLDVSCGYWLERSSQIYQAVRQGVGVGLGQLLLIGDELVNGSLVAPLRQLMPAPFSVYLVWPKRERTRPEVVWLREWMIAALKATETKLAYELPHLSRIDINS